MNNPTTATPLQHDGQGQDVPTLDLHVLKDRLTSDQRWSRACIQCGKAGGILKPAGKLLDIDVVECDNHQWDRREAKNPPVWLTQPCPAWCVTRHSGPDDPGDRIHDSPLMAVPLLTMDFINYESPTEPRFAPVELMVDLVQGYREAEPRIVLNDTSDKWSDYLSLYEAEQLAKNLTALVDAARRNTLIGNPTDNEDGDPVTP